MLVILRFSVSTLYVFVAFFFSWFMIQVGICILRAFFWSCKKPHFLFIFFGSWTITRNLLLSVFSSKNKWCFRTFTIFFSVVSFGVIIALLTTVLVAQRNERLAKKKVLWIGGLERRRVSGSCCRVPTRVPSLYDLLSLFPVSLLLSRIHSTLNIQFTIWVLIQSSNSLCHSLYYHYQPSLQLIQIEPKVSYK